MKICFYKSNSLTVGGGAENWILQVARLLSEYHDVLVIALNDIPMKRISHREVVQALGNSRYIEFPCIKAPRGTAVPAPWAIGKLLTATASCDLIYVILPHSPTDMIFSLLRKWIDAKLIAGFHGFLRNDILLQRMYVPLFKAALRRFDAYHVLNREAYDWLNENNYSSPYFIPNGVDVNQYALRDAKSNSNEFNVLFTGRLSEEKGADRLCLIIRYVNNKLNLSDLSFTITGSGPLSSRVEDLASSYNNVRYLGFVDSSKLVHVYESGDLYLLPSRLEGMPLRLLEAQACGLPTVGSAIPGVSDVICPGMNGQLVSGDRINEFAIAISQYHQLWRRTPAQYLKLKKRIRDYIAKNHDWKCITRDINEMFTTTVLGV